MQKKVPSMTVERAISGQKLYIHYCRTCHHLYDPKKFTDQKWTTILDKMLPKAKVMNQTDQELISDYLRALSK